MEEAVASDVEDEPSRSAAPEGSEGDDGEDLMDNMEA